jgi:hypothetical protein
MPLLFTTSGMGVPLLGSSAVLLPGFAALRRPEGRHLVGRLAGLLVRPGGVLERLGAVTPLGQTFSAGLAGWDGQEVSDELVARADRAVYAAKAAGRDRVVVGNHQPTAAHFGR